MTRDQLDIARQLLDLARGQGDPGEKGAADDLLRQLAERSFGSDQTLSPEGIQGLVGSGKEHLEGFSGSARDFLDWFESQLAGDSEPEGGGQETLQPDGADQETAVISVQADNLSGNSDDSRDVEFDVDDDMQATLVAPANKVPVPTTPVVEPEAREFGDYVLLEMIAQGGMGVVYKARQKKLNRIVAIKMIRSGQFADPSEVDRFYVEAEAAANLKHDNIVTVYEIGESDGQHFFSMDYIEGESLSEAVSDGPMLPETAASLMLTMTETIEFAHQAGILHRDLKPSNVLLDKQDKPLLTDFGLAKQVNDRSQLTMSGTVVGTPSYMPPEQAAARAEEVDVRSDVYSLGAILYELITGVAPFKAATTYDTLQQVLKSEPVNPRVLNSAVPVDLETICLKCLQKERERRYATAQDLADELQRFIEGVPIQARPVSRPEAMVRWCKRNPRIAALSGAAFTGVLVALVAMTISYFQILQAKEEAELSFRQAKKAVDEFFTEVAENRIWKRFPETESFRKQLLERTQSYYTQFMQSQQGGEELGYERAATNYKIARCFSLLGDKKKALPLYDQSIRQLRQLNQKNPGNKDVLLSLSNCLTGRSQIYDDMVSMDKAVDGFDEALGLRKTYREMTAKPTPEMLRKLANTYMNAGSTRNQRLRGRTDLEPEQRRKPRARIYGLFDNARSIREEALSLVSQDQADSEMTHDLVRDLAKGDFNLHLLFSDEYLELVPEKQTLEFWQRADGYLDEAVRHIRLIDESSLTMADRNMLLETVIRRLVWLTIHSDSSRLARDTSLQIQEGIAVALEYAGQLSLAKENPAFQTAALSFYLESAEYCSKHGRNIDVLEIFHRLVLGWQWSSEAAREGLLQVGRDPEYSLVETILPQQMEYLKEQIKAKSKDTALEFIQHCTQLLDIAEQNAWIPDGELLEYRSGLSELRQKIAQISE